MRSDHERITYIARARELADLHRLRAELAAAVWAEPDPELAERLVLAIAAQARRGCPTPTSFPPATSRKSSTVPAANASASKQENALVPTYDELALGGAAITRDRSREIFGQVMGLVALTVGCTALGAYIGRNLTGGTGIVLFIAALGCVIGLNIANSRGHEQLAVGLLFGLGLLLGLSIGPIIAVYAKAEPSALWQAAGATAAFVAACGAYGYATRRDLSSWARTLFWALLGLIVFGIVLIFVRIPHSHIIYAALGLGIFGAFTIFDFNRLRRANVGSAVPIAAGIFLDIFNIFLFMLQLFGGGRD